MMGFSIQNSVSEYGTSDSLVEQLPQPFAKACPVLLRSLGRELLRTEGNGLAPFLYLPHACVITECGLEDFANGMLAHYELTKHFSAELSIRQFLVKYRDECLTRLRYRAGDPKPRRRQCRRDLKLTDCAGPAGRG